MDSKFMSPNGVEKTLREKLKLFNTYFDEIVKVQPSGSFFMISKRGAIRISVSGTLSPAYCNFISKRHYATESTAWIMSRLGLVNCFEGPKVEDGDNTDTSKQKIQARIGELYDKLDVIDILPLTGMHV